MAAAPLLQVIALPRCPVARFVQVGRGLLARMGQPDAQPALVVAELTGQSLLLGRFQRRNSALESARSNTETSFEVLRRNGGGRTLLVGEGTAGVLLAVPEMGSLLDAPIAPEKVLNRYVRGLLAGLTRLGVPRGANYFGRDFISAQQQQVAVISQDNSARAALFEAVVAVDKTLEVPKEQIGYPEHGDPRAYGPPHVTLSNLCGRSISFESFADAVAQGYSSVHGALVARNDSLTLVEGERLPVDEDEAGWSDSGSADIAIGFAEGLVRHRDDRVLEARLRGDFIAPAFAIEGLEKSLAGEVLDFEALGRKVDAAFHQPGACLYGVRELRVFADAVLAAAGKL
jgi:lipoate-protein ligase A